tara:strand:+ start:9 stop:206 length:198 start_codon:yes stop_codon:yes gene_type:complete
MLKFILKSSNFNWLQVLKFSFILILIGLLILLFGEAIVILLASLFIFFGILMLVFAIYLWLNRSV